MLDDMNKEATILLKCTYIVANFANLFNTHEMEERDDQFMDQAIDVHDMLVTMQATLTLFKKLTNFTLLEFEELVFFCGACNHHG
jgi:hypothetical protein